MVSYFSNVSSIQLDRCSGVSAQNDSSSGGDGSLSFVATLFRALVGSNGHLISLFFLCILLLHNNHHTQQSISMSVTTVAAKAEKEAKASKVFSEASSMSSSVSMSVTTVDAKAQKEAKATKVFSEASSMSSSMSMSTPTAKTSKLFKVADAKAEKVNSMSSSMSYAYSR